MDTNRMPRIAAAIIVVAAAPLMLAAARGATPPTQTPPVSSATSIVVKITGAKQGAFKSEVTGRAGEIGKLGQIQGFGFQFELKSPRDAATGQASGKRQYLPITFTKEWGAASPQLLQALSTNEILTSVEFDFVRPNALGEQTVYYTIKLTNATVSALRSYIGGAGTTDQRALEDVSITFQKIEVEDKEGKTMAMDDWRAL